MKITFIVIGLILFVWFLLFVGLLPNYSDGERTGEIYKFSKKGVINKSWEGEMYLGGVSKDSEGGLVLDKFYFSIPVKEEQEKTELIEKIKECAQKRILCTVQYKQWLKSPLIYVDSSYIVTGVKAKALEAN